MATVNYTCPNCAAPLKFNPDKQMFSCEYCMSDFTEKYVQDFFAKKEQKENSAEKQEKKEQEKAKENAAKQAQSNDSAQAENKTEEEAVIYNCPSCGAQVVTTASTAATTCFYCQNPVVLGGRLSGEFKPDRVIPFKLSKQKAIDKFLEMCKRKWFLPKNFVSEKHFDKLTGVYFPYWYVDEQRSAQMVAKGEKVRSWTVGDDRYTETKVFELHRAGNLIVNNVFERALKGQDRDMLQCVHPYDLGEACRLIFGTRIVVNNSCLADKKLFKLIKRLRCKAFAVTVNIVVTQHNRKRIHLIFCKISPCKAVNQFEFIIADSLIFTVNNARNTAFNKFVILHSAPPLQSVFQCSSHLHC